MTISLLVAVSDNDMIGIEGRLPWNKMADDMKLFQTLTKGHHIIMGRKTYQSLGKPLPNRTNIVITRQDSFDAPGLEIVNDLNQALEIAKAAGENEVFIIGGAQIYKLSIHIADRIYLTRIHDTFEGDTSFPTFDKDEWKIAEERPFKADESNPHDFTFITYTRNQK